MSDPYWNHNVHHRRPVLETVPQGCRNALDAGCGDGLLAREPAGRTPAVTGVDRSAEASGAGGPAVNPTASWGEVGRTARAVLPGCRFRRLLLRRYLLVWDKP
ncbi:hypothetical protein [Streptosporangium sp. NPDC051022]|uniref:hypothetical protein n=1 Tax=Streptosporangium sp. NPDC051022 TaxID=3155752 RepID=UPI00342289F2